MKQANPHNDLDLHRWPPCCFGQGYGHTSSVTILEPRKFPIRNC